MAFQGFGRASGPSGPPNSSTPFGTFPPQQTLQQFPRASEADNIRPANFSNHSAGLSGSTKFPPTLGHEEKYISKGINARNNIRPSTVTSFVASRNSGTSLTATITHSQHFKGNRSAPLVYTEDLLSNDNPAMTRSHLRDALVNQSHTIPQIAQSSLLIWKNSYSMDKNPVYGAQCPLDLPVNSRPGSQIARSPPAAFVSSRFDEHFPPLGEAQRPALSSAWGGRQKLPSDSSNQLARENLSMAPRYGNSYDSGNSSMAHPADFHGQKRSRSPPMQSVSEVIRGNSQSFQDHTNSSMAQPADFNGQKRNRSPPMQSGNEGFQGNSQSFPDYSKRPSMSSLEANTRSNLFSSDSQSHRRSMQSVAKFDVEPAATKPAGLSIPKRTRSPPLVSADQSLQGSSYLSQDDSEREMQAKAKRLQRFKTELSETVHISSDIADQKVSAMRSSRSMVDREKSFAEISTDSAGDFTNDNVDNEGLESSSVIIGLCPDMCPDSERAERERKGDLDQYERIDGDRNQTSKSLAIKKYTRTAEREANLIRPMPILQKTIDYLLNLLDHPYNDRFLGLYNFLWDRMRAIRMDLRMQHIFNREAITMLEKMIRLHIIAMHELCEYTKGEGFSEGFDAHLNIEQMNKTSVELFQMYDDHRKKGINVPTEKEFRGYYALLKLDKHPGYKVEPAELSLDLAKMTPEIRQTPEVLFARDVARACRTGNFIAFFRLARKATYLQACLMHAHFSKLRTQALASLHCGVQNNQGLPVAHIANWIGMEEEDIESLLEYHGFVVKEFEELYMVKEGSFLNVDTDYPTKCSKLVHMKKSRSIVNDVLSSCLVASFPAEKAKEISLGKILNSGQKFFPSVERGRSAHADEDIQDFKSLPSPKDSKKVQPIFKPTVTSQPSKAGHQMAGVSHFSSGISFPLSSQGFQPVKVKTVEEPPVNVLFKRTPERVMHFGKEQIPSQFVIKTAQPEISPPQIVPITTQQDRTPSQIVSMRTDQQDRSPSQIVSRTTEQDRSPSQIVSRTTHQDRSPDVRVSYNLESSTLLSMTGSDIEDEDTPKMNEDDEITQKQDDEVAKAKLKLILRLWKRRSLRHKELREQRQLAASAALNSLSLGPPIRLTKDQQTTFRDFDIDHVMRERYKKHEMSCSRLNVSDVVAPVLSRRNPDAKCMCWKLLVCSHVNNPEEEKLQSNRQGAHLAAGPWLLSKLMPQKIDCDEDDMVLSSPGLSLWKKWIPNSSGSDQTCCLSVIRDTNFDNLNETVLGTNGVLFLVSDHLPWELQKIQLHNLVKSLPPASCLPLLILSSSYCEDVADPSSFIVKKLGLDEIDKSRVGSYLVGFLVENQSDGFLSDERLREGLQWLAGESPLQASLARVQTRDLILTRLNSSLGMCKHDICPEHCIYAFNVALDQTKLEVKRAANTNAACWPCPEVDMLEEFSDEHRAVDLYLPSVGWSYAARVEPLVHALSDCKLPNFANVSWLKRGCSGGEEIESQRLELENCLIRYMTETTNMMGLPLAKNEASVMLQKCARLELHNSTHYIIPNWVVIFRRIFNWRLTCFSNKTLSLAYVIEERVSASQGSILDEMELQDRLSAQYHLNHPSFDEMAEVSCNTLIPMVEVSCNTIIPTTEGSPAVTRYVPNEEFENVTESSNMVINEGDSVPVDGRTVNNDAYSDGNNTSKLVAATQETQKLTKLLEQCNILQNMIDKKLSIYF